jgi:hypothetical protein
VSEVERHVKNFAIVLSTVQIGFLDVAAKIALEAKAAPVQLP